MTNQIFELNEFTELVRGNEHLFLDRLQPLVRRQSVTLDLENVERIDAAGLAALVTVYCDARQAGHDFAILNPSHHVTQILALVGLDRILVIEYAERSEYLDPQLQESAA